MYCVCIQLKGHFGEESRNFHVKKFSGLNFSCNNIIANLKIKISENTVFPRINAPAFISYLDSSTRRLYEAGVCTRPALINYL